MFGIPRRFSHFIFAVIQAGLTCLIAAGVASLPLVTIRQFLAHWLLSWIISWAAMLSVVVLAAPIIRSVSSDERQRLSQGKVHPRNSSMPACSRTTKHASCGEAAWRHTKKRAIPTLMAKRIATASMAMPACFASSSVSCQTFMRFT